MSNLAGRAELLKLAHVLGVETSALQFLSAFPAEQLGRLREAVYELLFRQDRRVYRRLAAWFGWLPPRLLALLGRWLMGPLVTARVASELPARRALEVIRHLPPAFVADVAVELDPRQLRDVVQRIPAAVIRDVALEIVRRGEYVTAARFADFVSDQAIQAVFGAVDEAAVLGILFPMESRHGLDRHVQLLPPERLRRMLLLAGSETGNQAEEVLALLVGVSHGLRQKLGAVLAELPESVLAALVRRAQAENLWADLLPVIASMPAAGLSRLVNLSVLQDAALLEGIGSAADRHQLWGVVLQLVPLMDARTRAAMAASMARRGRVALSCAAGAALVGEHWEPLLDVVALMPPASQQLFAELVSAYGEVDPELHARVVARAQARGLTLGTAMSRAAG